jgi:WD40 repeat protein
VFRIKKKIFPCPPIFFPAVKGIYRDNRESSNPLVLVPVFKDINGKWKSKVKNRGDEQVIDALNLKLDNDNKNILNNRMKNFFSFIEKSFFFDYFVRFDKFSLFDYNNKNNYTQIRGASCTLSYFIASIAMLYNKGLKQEFKNLLSFNKKYDAWIFSGDLSTNEEYDYIDPINSINEKTAVILYELTFNDLIENRSAIRLYDLHSVLFCFKDKEDINDKYNHFNFEKILSIFDERFKERFINTGESLKVFFSKGGSILKKNKEKQIVYDSSSPVDFRFQDLSSSFVITVQLFNSEGNITRQFDLKICRVNNLSDVFIEIINKKWLSRLRSPKPVLVLKYKALPLWGKRSVAIFSAIILTGLLIGSQQLLKIIQIENYQALFDEAVSSKNYSKGISYLQKLIHYGRPVKESVLKDVISNIPYELFSLRFYGRENRITAASFSTDDRLLAIVHEDGNVKIMDFINGNISEFKTHYAGNRSIRSVVFSKDNSKLIFLDLYETLSIWEKWTGKCLFKYNILMNQMVDFKNSRYNILDYGNHNLVMSDIIDGKIQQINIGLPGTRSYFRKGLLISPDGKYITYESFLPGFNPRQIILDSSGKYISSMPLPLAFNFLSEDRFLTVNNDHSINIYSVNGHLIRKIDESLELANIKSIAISAESGLLAVMQNNGLCKIRNYNIKDKLWEWTIELNEEMAVNPIFDSLKFIDGGSKLVVYCREKVEIYGNFIHGNQCKLLKAVNIKPLILSNNARYAYSVVSDVKDINSSIFRFFEIKNESPVKFLEFCAAEPASCSKDIIDYDLFKSGQNENLQYDRSRFFKSVNSQIPFFKNKGKNYEMIMKMAYCINTGNLIENLTVIGNGRKKLNLQIEQQKKTVSVDGSGNNDLKKEKINEASVLENNFEITVCEAVKINPNQKWMDFISLAGKRKFLKYYLTKYKNENNSISLKRAYDIAYSEINQQLDVSLKNYLVRDIMDLSSSIGVDISWMKGLYDENQSQYIKGWFEFYNKKMELSEKIFMSNFQNNNPDLVLSAAFVSFLNCNLSSAMDRFNLILPSASESSIQESIKVITNALNDENYPIHPALNSSKKCLLSYILVIHYSELYNRSKFKMDISSIEEYRTQIEQFVNSMNSCDISLKDLFSKEILETLLHYLKKDEFYNLANSCSLVKNIESNQILSNALRDKGMLEKVIEGFNKYCQSNIIFEWRKKSKLELSRVNSKYK